MPRHSPTEQLMNDRDTSKALSISPKKSRWSKAPLATAVSSANNQLVRPKIAVHQGLTLVLFLRNAFESLLSNVFSTGAVGAGAAA